MGNKIVFALLSTLLLTVAFTFSVNFQSVKAEVQVGVKAGDWIKHGYTIHKWPSGQPYPEWLKIEFLSVEGTNATVRVTMHMSDGTEQNDTVPITIGAGGEALGLSGFVIPANLTVGDSVYISGYGNVTIELETTETYAGARRTVVYASFSQYGVTTSYYWDKLTGVMVEASTSSSYASATAKATETNMWESEAVYIRADGSIYPADAPISTINNITYTLTDNITSNTHGIIVERSNIIIDGAKFTIKGNLTDYGISLTGISNVTIKNTIIEAFHYGVDLYLSSNNTIVNSNIANNRDGISLSASSNNTITGNNITANNRDGIYLWRSSNNSISGNNVKANNKTGIYLAGLIARGWEWGSDNTISGNNITANIEYGIYIQESSKTIIHKNNITGNGQGILLDQSPNNTITLNHITNNTVGVYLDYSSYNTISENHITANNDKGIRLRGSSNKISNNNITNNYYALYQEGPGNNNVSANHIAHNEYGIYLYYSRDDVVSGNNITANSMIGLVLIMSSNNIVSGNAFTNDGMVVAESYSNTVEDNFVNGKPLVYLENISDYKVPDAGQVILVNCTSIKVENLNLVNTAVGVQLHRTTNTQIINNKMKNNAIGIYLSYSSNYNSVGQNNITSNKYAGIGLYSSFNNTFWGNNIMTNNESGVDIRYSSGNKFHHNNFKGNTKHVIVEPSGYVNIWDKGYPSGGNYWDNYTGTDTNGDGIGDDEYVIDANNTDRYPLTGPITVFYAGTWNETAYNVDVVSNSTVSNFHFNPEEGPFLRFNVSGDDGTAGFCRVTIPKKLLWVEDGQWSVLVGGEPVNYTIIPDENYTYIYFTYNHSIQIVTIQGTDVIPEFPSSVTLLGLLTLITIPIVFIRKKRYRKIKS